MPGQSGSAAPFNAKYILEELTPEVPNGVLRSTVVHTHYFEEHIVTADEAVTGVVNLTSGTYTIGNNSLAIFRNGIRQSITNGDYVETSNSSITFTSGLLPLNDYIIFEWRK